MFAQLGKYAFLFSVTYSVMAPPLLSLFSPLAPDVVRFYPAYIFPLPQFDTMSAGGLSFFDLLGLIAVAVINFLLSLVGGVVLIFNGLGTAIAESIPEPTAASFVRGIFTAFGALLQWALWSYMYSFIRGGREI